MSPLDELAGSYQLADSVSSLTKTCISKFAALEDALNNQEKLAIRNRLADFRLWADGVGAMAEAGHGASLDVRFKSRPNDLAMVKGVLGMLIDFIDDSTVLALGQLPVSMAISNIDSSITNLAMIGMAIRQTGKTSRSRRADQSFNIDDHKDFKKHLECIILLRPRGPQDGLATAEILEENIVFESNRAFSARLDALQPSKLTMIQNRLIEANLRRRHLFLLAQKRSHQSKKGQSQKISSPGILPPLILSPSPSVHTERAAGILVPGAALHALPYISEFFRASTAEGTLQYKVNLDAQDTVTVAQSQISFIAGDAEFPKPPLWSSNQLVCKCPCCCQSLPVQVLTDSSEWKRHLIEDLCPYTCISDYCPKPQLLHTTRKAWEAHVEKDHPIQWRCALCEEGLIFLLRRDIDDHINFNHAEELRIYSLETVISWSETRRMGVRSCPLCPSTGPEDSPGLVNHVLRHAYDFALRSLPWHDLLKKNLEQSIGTYTLPKDKDEADRLETWIKALPETVNRTLEQSESDSIRHPQLLIEKTDPCEEDYFAQNNYFNDLELDGSSKLQSQIHPCVSLSEPSGHSSPKDISQPQESLAMEDSDDPLDAFARHVDVGWKTGAIISDEKATAKYIPYHVLQKYWTDKRINKVLHWKLFTGLPLPVEVEIIKKDYLIVFSVLVFTSTDVTFRVEYIANFIRCTITDANLPLERSRASQVFPSGKRGEDSWKKFDEHQFSFNPVRLGSNAPHNRSLLPGCILPLQRGEKILGEYGRNKSVVHKYKVISGTGKLKSGDEIAVKETLLKRDDAIQTFESEVRAYISIANARQIDTAANFFLNYFGSFQQNGKGFILLEYANQSSLENFFSTKDVPTTREELYNLWKSFVKLIGGLTLLHDLNDYGLRAIHQDLKPSNILVFRHGKDPYYTYTFKIADFGLSSFLLNMPFHPDHGSTRLYGAPELVIVNDSLAHLKGKVTSEADIWSLGCIFFDMVVWTIGGERGLDEFYNLRKKATQGKQLLEDNGYVGAFHDGSERLGVLDQMLTAILSRRRIFDDLSEPLAKCILKKMLVVPANHRRPAQHLELDFEDILTGHRAAITQNETSPIDVRTPVITPTILTSPLGMDSVDNRYLNGHMDYQFEPYPSQSKTPEQARFRHNLRYSPDHMNTPRVPQLLDALNVNYHSPPGSQGTVRQPNTPTYLGPQLAIIHPGSIKDTYTANADDRQKFNAMPYYVHSPSDPLPPRSISQRHEPIQPDPRHFSDPLAHAGAYLQAQMNLQPSNELRANLAQQTLEYAGPSSSQSTMPSIPKASGSTLALSNARSSVGRANSVRPIYGLPFPGGQRPTQKSKQSIRDVLNWKKMSKSTRPELPGHVDAKKILEKREYIFIVDDNLAMVENQQQWKDVYDTLEVLTYLTKDYDETGVELYLTSNLDKRKKASRGESSSLLTFLARRNAKQSTQKTRMEYSLDKILEKAKVLQKPTDTRGRISELLLGSRNQTDVNIYILTNGIWSDDDKDGNPAVAHTIRNLVDQMAKSNRPRTSVMIQFIRFGDDPAAIRRLEYLDDILGKDLKFDIVDAKTTNNDVWEILIGSLDCGNDNLPEVPNERFNDGQPEGSNMAVARAPQVRNTGGADSAHLEIPRPSGHAG